MDDENRNQDSASRIAFMSEVVFPWKFSSEVVLGATGQELLFGHLKYPEAGPLIYYSQGECSTSRQPLCVVQGKVSASFYR